MFTRPGKPPRFHIAATFTPVPLPRLPGTFASQVGQQLSLQDIHHLLPTSAAQAAAGHSPWGPLDGPGPTGGMSWGQHGMAVGQQKL